MLVPQRHANTSDYRYGFQGQELDNEVKGEGNSINFKFRMHDPRVGRFFATDPLKHDYPSLSPYHFSHNSPIYTKEIEGLEGIIPTYGMEYSIPDRVGMNAEERKEFFDQIQANKNASAMGAVTGVAIWAGGAYIASLGVEGTTTLIVNEAKDEVLSRVTNGASDYLDLTKGAWSLLKSGWKRLLRKASKEDKIVDNGAADILKNLADAKDLAQRKTRIKNFGDPDGGKLSDMEAEGLAIFEKSFGKGELSPSLEKGVDAMLGNKRVSHFGTDPRPGGIDGNGLYDWLSGTFEKHFKDTSIDIFVIDLRKFNKDQRDIVLNKLKEKGEDVIKKTHVILD